MLARSATVDLGGKGLNQATLAARAGADVTFVGAIGDDAAGNTVLEALADEGIATARVQRVPGPTDESLVCVDPAGDNCIVTTHAAANRLDPESVAAALTVSRPDDWLLLQGNLPPELTAATVTAARAAKLQIAFNPSPMHPSHRDVAVAADLLVLNEGESSSLNPELVPRTVVTRGAAGALLWSDGHWDHVPGRPLAAEDSVGAGDVLTGVLVGRLDRGDAFGTALALAMRAAELQVQRPGTRHAFPTSAELRLLAG